MVKLCREPLIFMTIYVGVVGATALLRHWLFHTYAYDLGIFVQALSTTARGEGLLYETPDSNVANSYLGVHFSPILLVLVPLVILFPPAETLLLLQTVLLALPAYFIYVDAFERSGNRFVAKALSFMYLANPALHGINMYDFHTHSILLPLAYLFVKYARKLDLRRSIVTLLAMLTVTEHSIVLGMGYLMYIMFKSIEKRKLLLRKLVAMAIVLLIMMLTAFSIISHFGKPIMNPKNKVVFFAKLGSTLSEVLTNLFSARLLYAVLDRFSLKLLYWLLLFFPLLLLSTSLKIVLVLGSKRFELSFPNPLFIFKECMVFTLPWLAITLIASYPPFFTLGWHFNTIGLCSIAAVMPVLCRGLESKSRRNVILALFIIYSAVGSPLSPIPYALKLNRGSPFMGASYDFNPWFSNMEEELRIASDIRHAISMIPSTASVLATQNIFPHIATRADVYVHLPPNPPDYIIIDIRFFTWWNLRTQHWVYQQLVGNSTYVRVYGTSTVILLKRV